MCDNHNTTRCPKCGFGSPEKKMISDKTPEDLSVWVQEKMKKLPAWARNSLNNSAATNDLDETPKSSTSTPQVKEITITEISIKAVDPPQRCPAENSKWTVKPLIFDEPQAIEDCAEPPEEVYCDLNLEGVMSAEELARRNMSSYRPMEAYCDLNVNISDQELAERNINSLYRERPMCRGRGWDRSSTSDKNRTLGASWAPRAPGCDIDAELECEEDEDDFNATMKAASDCEDELNKTVTSECPPKPKCQPAQQQEECEEEEEFDPWDVSIAPLWATKNQSSLASESLTRSPVREQRAFSSPSRGNQQHVLNSTFICEDGNVSFGEPSNASSIGACNETMANMSQCSRGSSSRRSVAQSPLAGRRVGPSTLGGMFSRPAPAECRNLTFRPPPKAKAPCANATVAGKSNQSRRVTQPASRSVLYPGEVLPPPIFETVGKGQKSFTKFRKEMNPLATCRPGGKIPPNMRGQPEFVPIADETNVKMLPLEKCPSFTKYAKKQQPCRKEKPRCQPAMNDDPFNRAFYAQVPRQSEWHSFEARPECKRKRRPSI